MGVWRELPADQKQAQIDLRKVDEMKYRVFPLPLNVIVTVAVLCRVFSNPLHSGPSHASKTFYFVCDERGAGIQDTFGALQKMATCCMFVLLRTHAWSHVHSVPRISCQHYREDS
eukprot:3686881-Amphidinium_carterae.1